MMVFYMTLRPACKLMLGTCKVPFPSFRKGTPRAPRCPSELASNNMYCEGTEAVRGESDSKRPKLSRATQAKLAQLLLQLATTAQYSKVGLYSVCSAVNWRVSCRRLHDSLHPCHTERWLDIDKAWLASSCSGKEGLCCSAGSLKLPVCSKVGSSVQLQATQTACVLQNRTLVGVACHVIADMAYVIPDVVLPLAYERFQVLLHT